MLFDSVYFKGDVVFKRRNGLEIVMSNEVVIFLIFRFVVYRLWK